MPGRGSEKRRKIRSVLVRLSAAEYSRLSALADEEQTSRAECLRRLLDRTGKEVGATASGEAARLSDHDRHLLAQCLRTFGHLAGLMKRAVFEMPPLGRASKIRALLETHHAELQRLQGQVRAVLERLG